jgi:hypothetical protein
LKYGAPTLTRAPETASTSSGKVVPSSTVKASATKSTLFISKADSRLTAAVMRSSVRNMPTRHASSAAKPPTTVATAARRAGPSSDSVKACTLARTPLRVMKVPMRTSANVAAASTRFQARRIGRRRATMTECSRAVAVNHGSTEAFSTGSHAQ